MTPEQTDNVLELLASANVLNKLEEIGPDVWSAALGDLEYADCMHAAANLVRTHQWVKIADVRQAVHELRAARIEASAPVYEPPQGDIFETGAEFIQRRRRQLQAAADGRLPPLASRPVLDGPPHPSVVGVLAGAFQEVPGETGDAQPVDEAVATLRRRGALRVDCPECQARLGQPCKTAYRKKHRPHPHAARIAAAVHTA